LIAALRGIPCNLVIIGPIEDDIRMELRKNKIVFENRHGLTDAEIQQEYINCDLVTFCSLSEGFVLPVIEAQAMMVPVITSDRNPMKEIAGDGAMLVDPDDPVSIRAGIKQIAQNEELRRTLIENGKKNIRRFSVDKIVRQYEDIYKLII